MKPTTYLIYNESTGEWNSEPVTLAAARALPGVTLSTYLSTTDGARQLTVAQAIGEEQAAAPAPTPAANREPVYNAATNKWEYKEAAPSVFSKIKSVASGIITEINEACKEQAEAAREQHREPVYTLGGIPLETEPPKSAPVPSSPAPVPADTRSVPAEAAPVPPAGASVPKHEKQAPSWERKYPPLFSPEIKWIARHSKTILICLGVAAAFSALFIEPQYEYCPVHIEREDFERSSKAWVLVADDPSGAADCIPAQLAVRLEQGWEYVGPICNDGINASWILLRRKK